MSAPRRSSGNRPGPRGQARPGTRGAAPQRRRPSRDEIPPEPARQAQARRRTERRTQLTGRAAVLALVVAALTISLAYPIRMYVQQRGEMSDLREQVRRQEQRVADLQAERDRWHDPAYIRAQARDRLHYCMPSETCYVAVDPAAPSMSRTRSTVRTVGLDRTPGKPWYTKVWSSIEAASKAEPAARED